MEKKNSFFIYTTKNDNLFDTMTLLNDLWENDYLIVRNHKPNSYKYIKIFDRVTFVQTDTFLDYLVDKQYDAVFLHSLTYLSTSITSNIDKSVWGSWGNDISGVPPKKQRELWHTGVHIDSNRPYMFYLYHMYQL